MKTINYLAIAFLFGSVLMSSHKGFTNWKVPVSEGSQQVVINLQDAFFIKDTKDAALNRFVVNGLFPNSCYSFSHIEVGHESEFVHTVKTYANVAQSICMMVLVPFTVEGELGTLPAGNHSVKFVAGDGTSFVKTINIK